MNVYTNNLHTAPITYGGETKTGGNPDRFNPDRLEVTGCKIPFSSAGFQSKIYSAQVKS